MSGIRCVVEEAPDGTFSGSKKNDHVIIGTRPKGDTEEERDVPTLLGVAAQAFNQDGSIISRMLIGCSSFDKDGNPVPGPASIIVRGQDTLSARYLSGAIHVSQFEKSGVIASVLKKAADENRLYIHDISADVNNPQDTACIGAYVFRNFNNVAYNTLALSKTGPDTSQLPNDFMVFSTDDQTSQITMRHKTTVDAEFTVNSRVDFNASVRGSKFVGQVHVAPYEYEGITAIPNSSAENILEIHDVATDANDYAIYGGYSLRTHNQIGSNLEVFRCMSISKTNVDGVHSDIVRFMTAPDAKRSIRFFPDTQSFTINDSGSMGIGTTSPLRKLHIQGNALLAGDVAVNFGAGSSLSVNTDFVVNASGSLGVGTAAPRERLHVFGNAYVTGSGTFMASVGVGTEMPLQRLHVEGSTRISKHLDVSSGTGTFAALNVVTNNLGVGTANPLQRLHVQGNQKLVGNLDASTGSGTFAGLNVVTNNLGVGTANPVQRLHIEGNSRIVGNSFVTGTGTYAGLNVVTNNLGVGTAAPLQRLHVEGNARLVGNFDASTGVGTFAGLNVITDNVGVGTTAPLQRLHVEGNSRIVGNTFVTGTGTYAGLNVITNNLGVGTANPLQRLHVEGNARLVGNLDASTGAGTFAGLNVVTNNLGVGTANPLQKLHVEGNARLVGNLDASTGAGTFAGLNVVTNNLGVGTAVPLQKLHVEGNARLVGNLDASTGAGTFAGLNVVTNNLGVGTSTPLQRLHVEGNTRMVGNLDASGGTGTFAVVHAGYVGLGTFLPLQRLHVEGDAVVTGTLTFKAMNFVSENNLGVGTVSATQKLHVEGNTYISGVVTSNGMNIASNNLGVGTVSAVQRLHVEGTQFVSNRLGVGTQTPAARVHISNVSPANSLSINDDIVVNSSGSVGLGTATPLHKLHVVGNAYVTGSGTFMVSLGIGTTTPLQKLHIEGNTLLLGNLDASIGAGTFAGLNVVTNNLGVGTANPLQRLHVEGNARLVGNLDASTGAGTFAGLNVVTNNLGVGTVVPLQRLHVEGNTRLVGNLDVSTGAGTFAGLNVITNNLGVGTANPLQKLHVEGNARLVGNLDASTGAGTFAGLNVVTNNLGVGTANPLQKLHVEGNARLVGNLDASTGAGTFAGLNVVTNNLGVGTANPVQRLHVEGNSRIVGNTFVTGTGTYAGLNVISNNLGVGTATPLQRLHVEGNARLVGNLDASTGAGTFAGLNVVTNNLGIGTATPLQRLHVEGNSRIVGNSFVTGTGTYAGLNVVTNNLGVGTATPLQRLHVEGNARLVGNLDAATGAGTFAGLNVVTNNLGIGTATPLQRLHVEGNSRIVGNSFVTGTGTYAGLNVVTNNLGVGTANPLQRLHVEGNARLVGNLDASTGAGTFAGLNVVTNNLGVGTAAPLQKLHVVGNTFVTGAGTFASLNVSSNSLGIGTSDPTEKLHVIGNAIISGIGTFGNMNTLGQLGIGVEAPVGVLQAVGNAISTTVTIPNDTGYLTGNTNNVFYGLKYEAKAFSQRSPTTLAAYQAFSGTGNNWNSTDQTYDDITGLPKASIPVLGGTSIRGAWVGILLQVPFVATGFSVRTTFSKNISIVGTNDFVNFTVLYSFTRTSTSLMTGTFTNVVPFTGYAIVIESKEIGNTASNRCEANYVSFTGTWDVCSLSIGTECGASLYGSLGCSANIGAGTNSPTERLHVVGNALVTGTGLFGGQVSSGSLAVTGVSTMSGSLDVAGTATLASTLNVTGASSFSAFTTTGSVGIGTSRALQRLHVSGNTLLDGTATISNGFNVTSGNSGIGTANALQTLHVNNGSVAITGGGYLGIGKTIPTSDIDVVHTTLSNALTIKSNNNALQDVVINAYNNLGVGTSSPEYPLHVVGNFMMGTSSRVFSFRNRLESTDVGATSQVAFTGLFSARISIVSTRPSTLQMFASHEEFEITYNNDVATPIIHRWTTHQSVLNNSFKITSSLYFDSASKTLTIVTSRPSTFSNDISYNVTGIFDTPTITKSVALPTGVVLGDARFRMLATGNVGIGTAYPTENLHVAGGLLIDGDAAVSGQFSLSTLIASSNCGIGTAKPLQTLHVEGNTRIVGDVTATGVGTFASVNVVTNNLGVGTATPLHRLHVVGNALVTGSGTFASLNISTNNLGIGTAVPLSRIHINHTGTGNVMLVEDETSPDSTPFVINETGCVGVGTKSPLERLHVLGNTIASGHTVKSTFGIQSPGIKFAEYNPGYMLYTGSGTDCYGIGQFENGTMRTIISSFPAASYRISKTGTSVLAVGSAINTDFTDLVVVGSGGSVGIGTSFALQKLHVNGDILVSGNAFLNTGDKASIMLGDGGNQINCVYNDGISLATGRTLLKMKYDSNIIGVGTAAPMGRFHVDVTGATSAVPSDYFQVFNSATTASSNAYVAIRTNTASGGDPVLSWEVKDEQGWCMGIDNSDSNRLKIAANGSALDWGTCMMMDTNGNTGFGAVPSGKMSIDMYGRTSQVPTDYFLVTNTDSRANNHAYVSIRTHGGLGAIAGNPVLSWDVYAGSGWCMGIDNADDRKLKIASNWSNLRSDTRLTIDRTNGNVGLSTTSPAGRLHVDVTGKTSSTPSDYFYVYNDGTSGNCNAYVSIRTNGASTGNPVLSLDAAGVGGWCMGVDKTDNLKLKFAPNWADVKTNTRLTIDASGNVGIKTTTPQAPIHVNGDARIDGLLTCSSINLVPKGIIVMWYGISSDVPSGWVVCDGQNGTPDLRDKFVKCSSGTNAGQQPTKSGSTYSYSALGSQSKTTSSEGNHCHNFNTGSTAISWYQMPVHRHLLKYYDMTGENISDVARREVLRGYDQTDGPPSGAYQSGSGVGETSYEGAGEGHTHPIGWDGTHAHTISNVDPIHVYLWYIMKT
jgi:hypothetical protein